MNHWCGTYTRFMEEWCEECQVALRVYAVGLNTHTVYTFGGPTKAPTVHDVTDLSLNGESPFSPAEEVDSKAGAKDAPAFVGPRRIS